MLPSEIATETIQVLEAAEYTSYGQTSQDWTKPTVSATVSGCSVQPQQTVEVLDGRLATTQQLQVWAPLDAPVGPRNRIRWRGVDWRITGDVLPWHDPTGRDLSHVTFTVTSTRG